MHTLNIRMHIKHVGKGVGESFTNFSKNPMQPGDHRGKYFMAQLLF